MKHRIISFFKGSFIYILGRFSIKAFSLITMPVLTRFMSPKEYGTLSVANSISGVLLTIYGMGCSEFIARFYWEFKDEQTAERKRFFGSSFISQMLFPLFIAISLTISGSSIFSAFFKEVPFFPYIILVIWTGWIQELEIVPLEFMKIRNQANKFIAMTILQTFLTVSLTLTLVIFFSYGALAPLFSSFIFAIIFGLYYIFYTLQEIRFSYSFDVSKTFLKFSLPIVIVMLSRSIVLATPIWLLQKYAGLSEVAIYSVAASFGSIIPLILSSVHSAWVPFFYEIIKKPGNEMAPKLFGFLFDYILLFILFIITGLILFRQEIILIIASQKYTDAANIFPILLIGFLFNGLMIFATRGIYLSQKTVILFYITICTCILNFILCLLLIPGFGIKGGAFSITISYCLMFLTTHIISQKYYKIEYNYSRIIKSLLVMIIISILPTVLFQVVINHVQLTLLGKVIIKLFILMTFPILLIASKYFNEKEISIIMNWSSYFIKNMKVVCSIKNNMK